MAFGMQRKARRQGSGQRQHRMPLRRDYNGENAAQLLSEIAGPLPARSCRQTTRIPIAPAICCARAARSRLCSRRWPPGAKASLWNCGTTRAWSPRTSSSPTRSGISSSLPRRRRKPLNSALLALSRVTMVAEPDDWHIEFVGVEPSAVMHDGVAAIRLGYPAILTVQQRRQDERHDVLPTLVLRCVADAGGFAPFDAQIKDISLGGISVLLYPPDVMLEPGTVLAGSRIEIPGADAITIDLEVRYSELVTLEDGSRVRCSGFRFLNARGRRQAATHRRNQRALKRAPQPQSAAKRSGGFRPRPEAPFPLPPQSDSAAPPSPPPSARRGPAPGRRFRRTDRRNR